MAKFKIAVQWMVCAETEIEAESLQEAIREIETADEVPEHVWADGEVVEGSFEINKQTTEALNEKDTYIDPRYLDDNAYQFENE